MTKAIRFPTIAELEAIERAARLARAQFITGLVVASARGLKSLAMRCGAMFNARPRGTRHSMRPGI